MQDLLWVGLAALFYAFSAWFVGFSDRLMPAPELQRPEAEGSGSGGRAGEPRR